MNIQEHKVYKFSSNIEGVGNFDFSITATNQKDAVVLLKKALTSILGDLNMNFPEVGTKKP